MRIPLAVVPRRGRGFFFGEFVGRGREKADLLIHFPLKYGDVLSQGLPIYEQIKRIAAAREMS